MKYCTRCLLPETKPYISFDQEGVCSACKAHETKHHSLSGIDWSSRKKLFNGIVAEAKDRKAPYFDALVPVSGGKDSLTQIHRLLEYDLRILAVNVDYGIKTPIGRRNLALVPGMGAHLFTLRPELVLHKRLIRIGLLDYGDPDLLSHTLLHAAPLHVALRFQVPLVLLGENSAFEYGGDAEIAAQDHISRGWFEKYAANQGHDARHVSQRYGIPMEKLLLYDFPDEIVASGTRTVFSGSYFYWDSEEHLRIAETYGFETLNRAGEGTYRNYVGLDERINRIHQYIKVLKFGYGRATDHACEDIRNGRISRNEGKTLIRAHDLTPLSRDFIQAFCAFTDLSEEEFNASLERWRNEHIWEKDDHGEWYIPNHLEDT